ncbi:MAG: hypothetical protein JWR61_5447 [Ferruginibacter sp.]|uniref:ATP-dependent nuclease n=1 Tax=Ferruginibacter sp. TaxID=1940288 RepID=UPI002658CD10|nr:AAA family ATPase [Ferruginibacter sp.]MDB5280492.1 hypothetical protein [Ferruginibacter sp.]
MHITGIKLQNIRAFEEVDIQLSKSINLFVGQNNYGKSTILNAIHFLQGNFLNGDDVRLGEYLSTIVLSFETENVSVIRSTAQLINSMFNGISDDSLKKEIVIKLSREGSVSKIIPKVNVNSGNFAFKDFPIAEPDNLIYPFLSKRKVVNYSETMNLKSSTSVKGNFEDLYAKIDRLCNEDFKPAAGEYKRACMDILGYRISTVTSEKGKKAALVIKNMEHIPITAMGEGVVNIVGLIVDLCLAERKIFLIEELENDIHPKALKGLLNLIIEKSKTNQFFISTHSNIIVKYLGADYGAEIFKVSMTFRNSDFPIPISTVNRVLNTEEDRRLLLEDLGYEFNDFGLWNSWLFLEESSAEVLIREFLIPQFCIELSGKLRTFSANGLSEVEPKFRDFNNLFVFLHLTETYKNRAWVVVDSGDKEKEIIDKMKTFYVEKNGWNDGNFRQLTKHDFEEYYPKEFREKFELNKNLAKKRENLKSNY